MRKDRKISVAKFAVAGSVVPTLLFAYSMFGPPARHTGAPRDATCATASCHAGTPNSGPGKVEIGFPTGAVYLPGAKQLWTITVTDPDAKKYGFQVTARLGSNEEFEQAGDFSPFDNKTLVICEDNQEKPAGEACPAEKPLQFAQHSDASTGSVFYIVWTPPEQDVGDVKVYIAANAANGDGASTGDRIYTAGYTLSPIAFPGRPALREAEAVLQAFDNQSRLSSGTYIQIFGDNLAATTRQWNGADFNGRQAPTELDHVRVLVNGKPAFLSYISKNQINAQTPDDDAEGTVDVEVIHPGGSSNKTQITKTKVTPALQENARFASGDKKYVVAFHPDFRTFVGPEGLVPGVSFRPVKPGDVMIVFALGCGPTGTPAGQIPEGAPQLQLPYEIRFGDTVAEQVVGMQAPNFVGLYQFNVTVPNLSPGDYRIELTIDGVPTGQELYTTVGQ